MTGERRRLSPVARRTTGTDSMSTLDFLLERGASIELWLDPGECTGWAAWVTADLAEVTRFTGRLHVGQAPWRDALGALVPVLALHAPRVTLGWEDFVVTAGPVRDTSPLRVIGALELTCHQLRDAGLAVRRPASPAQRGLGAAHLVAVGWHQPGLRDANQAASHLLASLLRTGQLPADLLALITGATDGGR